MTHRLFRTAALAALLVQAASFGAAAAAQTRDIVQQRLPDGGTLLTDRPQPGARTERTWQITPDDAAAAQARREQAARESAAVSERIGRQLEAERANDLALRAAQARAAEQQAARQAWQARTDDETLPVAVWPIGRRHAGPPQFRDPGQAPGLRPTPTAPTPTQPARGMSRYRSTGELLQLPGR